MKSIKFKCTLLSDVIINQKAATQGSLDCLDFIPGSNFLGIAASKLYYREDEPSDRNRLSLEQSLEVFHSGKVRFGDAHPIIAKMRTLRIPASMHYPKSKKISEECYIFHCTDHSIDDILGKQLKQARKGFYSFANNEIRAANISHSYVLKSAYDRVNRRSKDESIFGYKSIDKGKEFCFEIELDDEAYIYREQIIASLKGIKHLGRSKSAQYGLVKIEVFSYNEAACSCYEKEVAVYADARLIFLDENGQPTFQPTPKQLGLEDGVVKWEYSQIRTFQYAPWNSKRQARDADRCGIEKGSVFIVDVSNCKQSLNLDSRYIGSFNNEGFGKVIYNPAFLQSKPNENGLALYRFTEDSVSNSAESMPDINVEINNLLSYNDDDLLAYLAKKKEEEMIQTQIYEQVNMFVEDKWRGKLFIDKESFASQWGVIRNIALSNKDNDSILEEIKNYISNGVKSKDWGERNRKDILIAFMDNENNKHILRLLIINLASAMAKECSKSKIIK